MQTTSLSASQRSRFGEKHTKMLENLPNDIQNKIYSYNTPADDLCWRMMAPAKDYKPNSNLALILNVLSVNGDQQDISSLYLKSLHDRDIAVLPSMNVSTGFWRVSAKDIHMLSNLPKGRVEQINTLFVVYNLFREKKPQDRVKNRVAVPLQQLNFALKNVTRLVVILQRSSWPRDGGEFPKLLPLEFEFELIKSDDNYTSVACALKWVPIDCLDEISLRKAIDILHHEYPKCILKDCLIGIASLSEKGLHIINRFRQVRWELQGSLNYLTEDTKKRISSYFSLYDDSPIDLSEFPNIVALDTSCRISTPNGFSSTSLGSLSIKIPEIELISQLFALRLPELRLLHLHGRYGTDKWLVDRLPFPFPKLIDFALYHILNVTIDMGNIDIRLYKLSLIKFHGNIIVSDNLHIDTLLLENSLYALLVPELCSRASRAKYTFPYDASEETRCIHAFLLEGMTDVICICKDRKLHYRFEIPKSFHASIVTTLQLTRVGIIISPLTFPCLQTIMLAHCLIQFYSGNEVGMGGLDFSKLVSLSIIESEVAEVPNIFYLQQRSTSYVSSSYRYLHAPRLKEVYIDQMVNRDWLIFSSLYCGELEMIYWVYDIDKDIRMPFTVNDLESMCFSKLRSLIVDGKFTHSRLGKRPGLKLTFPLVSVTMLHLLGDLVVPTFNQMRLSCQDAVFSEHFIALNLQGFLELSIRRRRSSTLEKVKKQVQTIMPYAEVLVVGDDVPWAMINTQSTIIHVKAISRDEKTNMPKNVGLRSLVLSDIQNDHFCGCCFYN